MRLFLLSLGIFLIFKCSSQQAGFFISSEDFRKDKIFKCKSGATPKFKLHALPYRNYVSMKCGDSVYHFLKDSIFGYRDTKTNYFRFYKREIYSILNESEKILLYKKEISSEDPKDMRTYEAYYFSKDENSPLYELKKSYLLKVFSSNEVFTDLVETHFKNDDELTDYDPESKKFKINRLFELSNKK